MVTDEWLVENLYEIGLKIHIKWLNFSKGLVEKIIEFGFKVLFESKRKEKWFMIPKNSRQVPSTPVITREKNYCDLLYAWLQCESEPAGLLFETKERRILKSRVRWTRIEEDFTRYDIDGKATKIVSRKMASKYFGYLVERGLVYEKEGEEQYFYLRLLDRTEANLIQYETLSKLVNVLQKNSLSIYVCLFNEFYRRGMQPFIITMGQLKEFIGVAKTTSSNNIFINDTLEILERLGLLSHELVFDQEANKRYIKVNWVRNQLPRVEKEPDMGAYE